MLPLLTVLVLQLLIQKTDDVENTKINFLIFFGIAIQSSFYFHNENCFFVQKKLPYQVTVTSLKRRIRLFLEGDVICLA